jgi:hypothetical protein
MSKILEEAAIPALRHLKLKYLRTEDGSAVAVPIPLSDSTMTMLYIQVDDEQHEVMLGAEICAVASRRRGEVAVLIAGYNARYKYITFSMASEGTVVVDICVDLAFFTSAEIAVERSIVRVLQALSETYEEVVAAARKKGGRSLSRVEREASEIIRRLES